MTTPVVRLGDVDSTNAEALRRNSAGEQGPVWIVAGSQAGGRGRAGRAWASPPGNLYASLLFRPGARPEVTPQLSLVSGLAVAEAIAALAPPETPAAAIAVKWPNDVLSGAAKLVGILPESVIGAGGVVAVIGIGVNVAHAPAGLGREATSLVALGIPADPDEVLAALDARLGHWLDVWRRGEGLSAVREAWLARAHPPGTAMSINTGDGPIDGNFEGLDADGALLLRVDEGIRRFTFGDVLLRAPRA